MWIKAKISSKLWNNYYSKITGYTFLSDDGNGIWIGFTGVILPDGCLEITNVDELLKIQRHRELERGEN